MSACRKTHHLILGYQSFIGFDVRERQVFVGIIQWKFELLSNAVFRARRMFGWQPQAPLPQELPSRDAKAITRTNPNEIFNGITRQVGRRPTNEVTQTLEGSFSLSFYHGSFDNIYTCISHETQTNTKCTFLNRTVHVTQVDVG